MYLVLANGENVACELSLVQMAGRHVWKASKTQLAGQEAAHPSDPNQKRGTGSIFENVS